MKPSEVSARIGIAASTIRAWTAGEYRQYLSPAAQGGSGVNRSLTEVDARILLYIYRRKQQGVKGEDIHAELARLQDDEWQNLPDLSGIAGAAMVPVVPQSTAAAALESQTRALLREVSNLEQEVARLRGKTDEKDETILDLTRRLAEAETELRLYREGRLKPDEK